MSKRMQVLMDPKEYENFKRMAERRGLTLAGWVRQVLRAACRREPQGNVDRKLAAVRAASGLEYPTADIDQMLAEIERGYLGGGSE